MHVTIVVAGVSQSQVKNILTNKVKNTFGIVKTESASHHFKGVVPSQLIEMSAPGIHIFPLQSIGGIETITATKLNQEYNTLDFDCKAVTQERTNTYSLVSLDCNSQVVSKRVPTINQWGVILTLLLVVTIFRVNNFIKRV
jgi:hypothetical protein